MTCRARYMSSTATVLMPRLVIWATLLFVGERVAAQRGYSPYVLLVLLVILVPIGIFAGLVLSARR